MENSERKQEILEAALLLAYEGNYATITRAEVAKIVGCTPPLINNYFKTMCDLRTAVLKLATKRGINRVINQGIVNRDKFINGVPVDILKSAAKNILSGL